MNQIIANFQFIRPEYLLALIPLVIGYVIKLKYGRQTNIWQQILPNHLYQNMVIKKGVYRTNKFLHVFVLSLFVSVIALAGPTWEKLPQTVYQSQAGKVVLLDMSMSMRATDIAPDRLTRAKFKALDLVDEVREGETGIVAYAGDAFVISPLTEDIGNLKTLIPSLSPEIMPIQGSYALYGLKRSEELLLNAGYQSGQIYWITDGILYEEIKEIREFIQTTVFDVSALLIGTEAGAPISMVDGQLLKDRTGKIVIPSIDERYMNQAMQGTSGVYQLFTPDNSDIMAIKRKIEFEQKQASQVQDTTSDVFKDMGPYLVLLLLPVAAYTFRKGILTIVIPLGIGLILTTPQTVFAQSKPGSTEPQIQSTDSDNSEMNLSSWVNALFKNDDQRGKLAFDNNDFKQANQLFKDKEWQAASAYKMGNFEQAEAIYNQLDGIDNLYNKANAQAKQGKLIEALESYDQVLQQQPSHEQAKKNKAIVKELLEQQSNNDQSQQNDSNQDDSQNENSQQNEQQNQDQQNTSQQENTDQSNEQNQINAQSDQGQKNQQQNQNENSQSPQQKSEQENSRMQAESEQEEFDNNNRPNELNDQNQQHANNSTTNNMEEQKSAISNQIDMDELTPEQKEELQRMQMIMNKVPDDPAFLLKRKMMLEAQKRQRTPQAPTQQTW